MKNNAVYEIAIGRLKEGVSREDYLNVTVQVENDLRQMSGFRSRRLLTGTDGLWIDLVQWDSMDEALKAAEIFPTLPSAQPMEALLDFYSVQMYHMELVFEDNLSI